MTKLSEYPWGPPKCFRTDEARFEWSQRRAYCAACWIGVRESEHDRFPQGIQIHELVGGAMRSLEPANYLTLCSKCHAAYHSGGSESLHFGQMLYFKWESTCLELGQAVPYASIVAVGDQERWNPYRLEYLRRPQKPPTLSVSPPIEPLPAWLVRERLRYGPSWSDGYAFTVSQYLSLGIGSVDSDATYPRVIRFTDSGGSYERCTRRIGPLATWTPASSPASS